MILTKNWLLGCHSTLKTEYYKEEQKSLKNLNRSDKIKWHQYPSQKYFSHSNYESSLTDNSETNHSRQHCTYNS